MPFSPPRTSCRIFNFSPSIWLPYCHVFIHCSPHPGSWTRIFLPLFYYFYPFIFHFSHFVPFPPATFLSRSYSSLLILPHFSALYIRTCPHSPSLSSFLPCHIFSPLHLNPTLSGHPGSIRRLLLHDTLDSRPDHESITDAPYLESIPAAHPAVESSETQDS